MRWQVHSLFTSKLWLNHSWFSVIWGFCAVVITCAVCFYFRNRITDTVCFCFRKLTSICIHTVKFTQPAPQENTAWFIDVPLFNLAQNLLSDATDNIFHCPAYLDVSLQQHQLLREHLWPHLCRGWATVRIIYVAVKSPHGLAELLQGIPASTDHQVIFEKHHLTSWGFWTQPRTVEMRPPQVSRERAGDRNHEAKETKLR